MLNSFSNTPMLLTETCFYIENQGFGGATNRDMLLLKKSSLWGCNKLRHVTNRDVLLLATLRYVQGMTGHQKVTEQ